MLKNDAAISLFKNVLKKADLEFDYETSKVRIDEKESMDTKVYITNSFTKNESKNKNKTKKY